MPTRAQHEIRASDQGSHQLTEKAIVVGEGLREGKEDDGAAAAAAGGERALQEVVEDEGAARLDAVLHEDDDAAAGEWGGGSGGEPHGLVEKVRELGHRPRQPRTRERRLSILLPP